MWKAADAHQEGEAEVIAAAEEAEQAAIHKAESTIDHAHKDVEEIKAIILIAKESVSACFLAAKDAKAEAKVARGAADWKDSCHSGSSADWRRRRRPRTRMQRQLRQWYRKWRILWDLSRRRRRPHSMRLTLKRRWH